MYGKEGYSYSIIFNIRKKGELSLADLLEAVLGKRKFEGHSPDGAFGQVLIDLLNARFIEIVGDKNELKKLLDSPKFKRGQRAELGDGYYLALKVNPESIFLKITDYFFRVQDIIGFSVSEGFSRRRSYYDESIWGEANRKLKTQVFVIMPFSESLRPIYDDHILKVCNKIGYSCLRADDIFDTGNIMNAIWSYIKNADVIVCDCTGQKPNVFYELGIAHGIGKNVICLTQDENDVPSDIRSLRYLKYEYTPKAMVQFEEKLEQFLAIAMTEAIGGLVESD